MIKFATLVIIVFFFLLIFLFPKILYIATLIYHALFKEKMKVSNKKSYSLKDLKEVK